MVLEIVVGLLLLVVIAQAIWTLSLKDDLRSAYLTIRFMDRELCRRKILKYSLLSGGACQETGIYRFEKEAGSSSTKPGL